MNAANVSFPGALAGKAGTAVLARVRLVASLSIHEIRQVFRQDTALLLSWANVGSEVFRGVLEQNLASFTGVRIGGVTASFTLLLLAMHIENKIIQQPLIVLKQSSHFLLMPR